jgi:hypothetical protein
MDHAFLSISNGGSYRPDQSSRGELPHPHRFIKGTRNQITIFFVNSDPLDPGRMHPGLDAQDWVFRWLIGIGNCTFPILEDLKKKEKAENNQYSVNCPIHFFPSFPNLLLPILSYLVNIFTLPS